MKIALLLLSLSVLTISFKFNPLIVQNNPNNVNAIPWPYTLCGDNIDWKIQTLTIGQVVKRNINDDVDISGTCVKSVTFKRVQLIVKLNGVFLDKQVLDFTESYESGDHIEFNYKQFIPSFAPAGTYLLSFQFIDSNEKNNGCLAFSFKL